MRVSVKKSDVGYTENGVNFVVKINGEFSINCITADEELGEALVYKVDQYGQLICDDNDSGSIATEIVKGDVQITLVKDWAQFKRENPDYPVPHVIM